MGSGKPSGKDTRFQTNLVTETQANIYHYFSCEPLRIKAWNLSQKKKSQELQEQGSKALCSHMEKTTSGKFSDMELISHDRNIEAAMSIYLSKTCYKLTQPEGWALSQQCKDSQKKINRSQRMNSSSVTFISLVNVQSPGWTRHSGVPFIFPLEQVHLLELMHNSLRELSSVPEYKLDFKKKSPLEHYVQGRSDRNHCTVSWIIRS